MKKMIKIEIKNRFTGYIIFEYSKENNTIKETLLQALKENADLRHADLRHADLSGADLRHADLRGAYLRHADLRHADLRGADLSGAYLRGADLSGAYLSGADLSGADLSGAYLRHADLRHADLRGADLSGAYLRHADLRHADLRGADLSGAKNKEQACLPIFCKWSHCIIGDKIKIGCKEKTIEEWEVFFGSNEEYETSRNIEDFKQIQAVFEAYKGYLTFLNK